MGKNRPPAGSRARDRPRPPTGPRRPGKPNDRNPHSQRSDSWRPGGGRDARDRFHPQGGSSRDTDSYRPDVPRGDFTFRVPKPAGAGNFANGYAPDNRGRRDRRGNYRGGRRWQPPPPPSARALISGAMLNLPEGRVDDGSGTAKFRNLDEISDDDEQEMEISGESGSEEEQPSKKRARTGDEEAGDDVPKWSNPDPYTALPCPDETTRKKRDVVQLIRKARVEDAAKPDEPSKAENFLSFDLTEDEEGEDEDEEEQQTTSQIPSVNGASDARPANGVSFEDRSGPLGSRKRTAQDEIKPPDYGSFQKGRSKPSKGSVVADWLPKRDESPCPWATYDHRSTHNMAFRLHKELVDFYEYVRPREFEQRIRDLLVDNLRTAMRRDGRNFASAQVHPFGSFMSGLYLPTADMDLVVCSASFMRGGPPTYLSAKNWLYKFQKFLVMQRVADSDAIQVISHARIPLVKYVDKLTGLKVDVSFENLGGVTAIDTFLDWKKQYPAMPILVTVIKHFLLMRGLNEPVNGGIGGFTVICLVVSMLQLMPQVQSRSMIPEHHLGEVLLEFLDLYGRQFQFERNAISLTRPVGYIKKAEVQGFAYKSTDRLSIIDPNNSANDISGGSSNTPSILARFEDAFHALRNRMRELGQNPDQGGILDVIMQGNYSSFQQQREFLRHVHERIIGPC